MKKIYRLKKNWEFDSLMKSKTQLVNKYVIVYYKKSDSFKAGITVPKKFASAVGRNFYKRQMRSIVRNLKIFNLNYNFVFIIRKEFLNTNFNLKYKSIEKLLSKITNEK